MDPVCFYIGSRPIYWYGVMVATAFLAAVAHWNLLARKEGLAQGYGSEMGFWIMLAGIVGARIGYVLANFSLFAEDPLSIFRIDQGGLVYYGGFIGAVVAVYVMARVRKQPPLWVGDFAVSALPLGHAIGRVGCFLNGCCYGSPSSVPWAVHLEGCSRHPTQLYEAGYNLLLYGLLLLVYRLKQRNGTVLAAYLMLYPVGRFCLEFIRGDSRMRWYGLTVAQEISIALFVGGTLLLFFVRRKDGRNPETPES